jgi:hypothetical protein
MEPSPRAAPAPPQHLPAIQAQWILARYPAHWEARNSSPTTAASGAHTLRYT